jgi:DNA recombination protein RmuC
LERQRLVEQSSGEMAALRSELSAAQLRGERLETELGKEREHFADKQRLLLEAEGKLKDAFAAAGQEALQKNNESFLELARSRFEPMRTLMEEYQKRLAEIEQSRARSHNDISQQLGSVAEAHRQLSTTTAQLLGALSNPGTRGRWGEIGLERVLELSGMTAGIHYEPQFSFSGEEGRGRPDVRVNLPGGKCVIIDSKYPGKHFFEALECQDAGRREGLFKQYAQAVRSHAMNLRSRDYWRRIEGSPEFVVMYLSGEAMVYAAAQVDPSLLEDMFRERVIIATPTTLMALLKAVAHGWQATEVAKGIEEVKAIGAQIVERAATWADHFNRLGRSLDAATQSYNQAVGSLETRLLVSARRMRELGVSTQEIADLQPVDTAARQLSARTTLFEPETADSDDDDALA